jgi:hypothetical protein
MNRFCGMCGTPLLQKPITAPGAQSTLSFTRLPLDVPQPSASTPVAEAKAANVEAPRKRTKASARPSTPASVTAGSSVAAPVAEASVAEPKVPAAPAQKSYFTQAEEAGSLEQFIAGFRYTPPTEGDEVTMTGDRPVVDFSGPLHPTTPASLVDEPVAVTEPSTPPVKQPPHEEAPYVEPQSTEPPPFATKSLGAQAPERSRFLDLGEQPESEPIVEPTPSIGGPSFLGLSDTPAFAQEQLVDAAPRSHWRAWLALIVILVFAGLGYLEWRAEKNQSGSGPMGIMKMQIERLKGKKAVVAPAPTIATPEAAPAGAQPKPSGSGPDMQVVPGQQRPQTTPLDNGKKPAASPEKPTNPGVSSTTPGTPTPAPESKSPAAQNSQPGTPNNGGVAAATNTPAPAIAEESSDKETQTQKPVPGAEDLAKARNASDAAAASAWLWKSVGKGNPEAPVKLANMYISGDGVPQNCEQALVLLRSAAAKENAAAYSRLGSMYATATCVPRDRVRAYEYMSSAVEANPNASWARDFREQLWAHMTPQERTQAQKYR